MTGRGGTLGDRVWDRLSVTRAALLVIDMQNDFCHSEGALAKRGVDTAPAQEMASRLIAFIGEARSVGLPLLYTMNAHDSWTNSPSWKNRQQNEGSVLCVTGSWGAELYKVSPLPEERVVVKHRYSAFVGTDLDLVLRSRGIESLLFTGVATNVCVESTARDAYTRDYQLVLIRDCLVGSTQEEHLASLKSLERYFDAVTIDSHQAVGIWKAGIGNLRSEI